MMGTRCTGRSRNLVLVYDIGCFIPARKGSERVKNKNLRPLGGVPLVEIAILQALTLFDPKQVYLSTDSDEIYEYTTKYGLGNLPKRPARFSRADSPDIQWVLHAIESLGDLKPRGFMILRPTNPFRSAKMLHDVVDAFEQNINRFDSLRAVQACSEHPAKMWKIAGDGKTLLPILPFMSLDGTPWHSQPYQSLPEIYVQNASLEIALTGRILETKSIAGATIQAFLTSNVEGFDINSEIDFVAAEVLLKNSSRELENSVIYRFLNGS